MLLGVSIVAGLYAALVGAAFFAQRSLMYHPAGPPPSPAELGLDRFEAASVATSDGLELTAWYAPAPAGAPTVVVYHGNAGNLENRAGKFAALRDAGLGVLGLQFRGYGGNPGRPTEQGLYRDAEAALAFLAERGVGERATVLYGESLGTGVAVEMATRFDVAAVILEAPYLSVPRVAQRHYPILPARLLVQDRFDSASKIPGITVPVLALHGTGDRIIPPGHSESLLARAGGPAERQTFEGRGHSDIPVAAIATSTRHFLARHGVLAGPGDGGHR